MTIPLLALGIAVTSRTWSRRTPARHTPVPQAREVRQGLQDEAINSEGEAYLRQLMHLAFASSRQGLEHSSYCGRTWSCCLLLATPAREEKSSCARMKKHQHKDEEDEERRWGSC